jgi:hypothetical protein
VTFGWGLLLVTLFLVSAGCLLYVLGWVGFAQLLWVFASGTAGAGVMALYDDDQRRWR